MAKRAFKGFDPARSKPPASQPIITASAETLESRRQMLEIYLNGKSHAGEEGALYLDLSDPDNPSSIFKLAKEIDIPEVIEQINNMESGQMVVVSLSGGKPDRAMTINLASLSDQVSEFVE